jgi:hypothetical protein
MTKYLDGFKWADEDYIKEAMKKAREYKQKNKY